MKGYTYQDWQRRQAVLTAPKPVIPPRRTWVIGGTLTVVLVGLIGRLAYWQIGQHQVLAARASAEHQRAIILPSGRGTIADRNGTILALTVTGNCIILDPQVVQQVDKQHPGSIDLVAQRLADLTKIPVATVRGELTLVTAYRVLTAGNGISAQLDATQSAKAQDLIDQGLLPGTVLRPLSWRVVPGNDIAAQVLGFVRGDDGAGQYGVEQSLDSVLAGTPGKLYATLDASGNPLAVAPQRIEPAIPGGDVALTLDMNIQAMAYEGLRDALQQTGATGGTVIVADPQTGAILALANAPSFDPNSYANADQKTYRDSAISDQYDPGSTMKALTMAMGIDLGTITPDTSIIDNGTILVGNTTIANWNQLAWGTETMTQVLIHSANVGAAWVALNRIGYANFANYLHGFGFGAVTRIELPGEAAGKLAPKEPTAALQDLDLAENSFGESIAVTPLQMVMAYSALANGGMLMQPHIVASVTRNGKMVSVPTAPIRRVISATTATTVTQMLVQSGLHGDAQTGLIHGYTVAAKTGTSTPDPANPSRTYASVLGYAPAKNPRFVVLVKLDFPQTSVLGGEAAGPLWRGLVRQLMSYAAIPAEGEH
jgi:cell division protein FtsI/penicillin-binding protein 2